MSEAPFFSVCVPTYNGEPYLRECLDSILAQTFGDFELLVVDDCSSDGSVELVRDYQERDARIRLVENASNLGLVANWNRCLVLARGRWIKFLFQDDAWDPTCLAEIHARSAGRRFVFHRRRLSFDGEVRPQLREFYQSQAVTRFPGLVGVTELSTELVRSLVVSQPGFNFFGEPSSVAFARELVATYGSFDERLVQLCDYEYWTRLTSNIGGYQLEQELSTFRVHGNATSSANLDSREFRFTFVDKLLVLHRFANATEYASLRAGLEPGVLEKLYLGQARRVAGQLRLLPRASRAEALEQLAQLAPFALGLIVRLAKRRLGFLRADLKRFLNSLVSR